MKKLPGKPDIRNILEKFIENNHDLKIEEFNKNIIYSNIIDSLTYFLKSQNKGLMLNLTTQNNYLPCSYWHNKVEKAIIQQYKIEDSDTIENKQKIINKYTVDNIRNMIASLREVLLTIRGHFESLFLNKVQQKCTIQKGK